MRGAAGSELPAFEGQEEPMKGGLPSPAGERAFPAGVLGPVDRRELRRLDSALVITSPLELHKATRSPRCPR
jgi:hypothetical protein